MDAAPTGGLGHHRCRRAPAAPGDEASGLLAVLGENCGRRRQLYAAGGAVPGSSWGRRRCIAASAYPAPTAVMNHVDHPGQCSSTPLGVERLWRPAPGHAAVGQPHCCGLFSGNTRRGDLQTAVTAYPPKPLIFCGDRAPSSPPPAGGAGPAAGPPRRRGSLAVGCDCPSLKLA